MKRALWKEIIGGGSGIQGVVRSKRLAILEELRGGEKCACVLQEPMELTQSGLSYHMKVLCESGLVESRQEGKWTTTS